jgi:hypothetical protein
MLHLAEIHLPGIRFQPSRSNFQLRLGGILGAQPLQPTAFVPVHHARRSGNSLSIHYRQESLDHFRPD